MKTSGREARLGLSSTPHPPPFPTINIYYSANSMFVSGKYNYSKYVQYNTKEETWLFYNYFPWDHALLPTLIRSLKVFSCEALVSRRVVVMKDPPAPCAKSGRTRFFYQNFVDDCFGDWQFLSYHSNCQSTVFEKTTSKSHDYSCLALQETWCWCAVPQSERAPSRRQVKRRVTFNKHT